MKRLVSLVPVSFVGRWALGHLRAERSPADAERYGPYPTNYKEIVMKWLDTQLIDAGSARIEWDGDPKPANLGTKDKPLYGYLVNFKVNRSEEHTSELQSQSNLVCRLLLEKKKQ